LAATASLDMRAEGARNCQYTLVKLPVHTSLQYRLAFRPHTLAA
jgi:hypothetical protein